MTSFTLFDQIFDNLFYPDYTFCESSQQTLAGLFLLKDKYLPPSHLIASFLRMVTHGWVSAGLWSLWCICKNRFQNPNIGHGSCDWYDHVFLVKFSCHLTEMFLTNASFCHLSSDHEYTPMGIPVGPLECVGLWEKVIFTLLPTHHHH